ncbi:polysaccharide biosynthesis tyrosine autokinase [Microbacterium sp. Bi128]|uniref:polysaccharide biosynthesis tyrosine autokinase n=1 Tax=Microbacterium sp. Bi128 TaxID=2821115 RepID=UPI001D41939A|nr:polysaccharide biosynthesis tyrosine autokinase [Microbacterium sp. Bi128]CAH0129873.1 Tyrosine-protein kinase YwqD [Microbacterium sp. Bi128]
MELRDYLQILHRNWVLLLVATLVGGGLAVGVSFLQTPRYEATTKLYVSARSDAAGINELAQGTSFARQAVVSFVDVVNSSIVLERVIDQLRLDTTPDHLRSAVSASTPLNSVIISVTVSDPDPSTAAAIANSVGTNFSDVVVNTLERPQGETASLVRIETIEPALVPTTASSPNFPLTIALGLVAGLALGVILAVGRSVLDTRIHSRHDIEAVTDLPVLGGIPYDVGITKRPLIVESDRRSPGAEAFRSLRTNLQFVEVDGAARTFVVSSAGPGEGKSVTTVNLALALAETGAKVALVDGDLRLPRIAEYMGLEGGAGLTDVLIGRAALADVLQQWGKNKLYILPSGRIPPNPAELLGSEAMRRTIEALTTAFDYVLIDAPPLLLVTDAAVISRLANGTLLVAASGSTRKPQLSAAVEKLNTIGSRIFGVVVTKMPPKGPDSYGYGEYSYAGVLDEDSGLKGRAAGNSAKRS